MKDDTPDYSRYTLEDLHDVARRVNKQLYPERYALIVQELEKRQPPRTTASAPGIVPRVLETEGCLLPFLRFVGGYISVIVASMFLLVWGDPHLVDPVPQESPMLWTDTISLLGIFVIAPLVGLYLAFWRAKKE